jgi:arabinofuranosyltransferase
MRAESQFRSPKDASGGRALQLFSLAFVCAVAALAAGAWHYRQFMADDAFISLRYADRLVHGQGLTWNDGEVVEGYTNLLWVLGCALLGRLGLDLVWAARVLGALGTTGAIAAVIWVYRAHTIREALPGFAGGLALGLAGPVVVWTFGGLEQPLLAGLLAWALAFSFPLLDEARPRAAKIFLPGLFFGLVALTRADGALFTFAAYLGILAARGWNRESLRIGKFLILLPLLFFAGQMAFRHAYYHEWLPNSAFAKVGFSLVRAWTGTQYVAGGISLAGILVPAMLAFRAAGPHPLQGRVRFLGVVLAVWLAYLVIVGGDLFPGRRHLVPAVVVLVYLATIYLARRIPPHGSLRPALGVGALCLSTLALFQILDPMNVRAKQERWEWAGEAVGGLLAKGFGAQRPLLAVDPAGCVPYFSRLPSVDMLGINDHYLAHHRPADFGRGSIGHELGDGAYVLSRKPDLVLFNLPQGGKEPTLRSGIEMMSDPRAEFTSTFRPVTVECERPMRVVSVLWMRTEGGAIGISRSEDRIQIPGYLFSDNEESRARLDAEGHMGVAVLPGTHAEFSGLLVPPGRWAARVEGSGGAVTMNVEGTETGATFASGEPGSGFSAPGSEPTGLTISLWTQDGAGAHVREIVLERLPSTPAR